MIEISIVDFLFHAGQVAALIVGFRVHIGTIHRVVVGGIAVFESIDQHKVDDECVFVVARQQVGVGQHGAIVERHQNVVAHAKLVGCPHAQVGAFQARSLARNLHRDAVLRQFDKAVG